MSAFALSRIRRSTVAVSVVAGAVLAFTGQSLLPAFVADPAAYAATLGASGAAVGGAYLLGFSQLFWVIGLVGVAHLASRRAPVFSLLGGALLALGGFGHAVYVGSMLTQVALASGGEIDATVAAMGAGQSPLLIPFLALGLFGTALGGILLGVGLLRARIMPTWVPGALIAWAVIEFGLSSVVDWASYLSLVVGLIAFTALGVFVWRSALTSWQTMAEAEVAPSEPSGTQMGQVSSRHAASQNIHS